MKDIGNIAKYIHKEGYIFIIIALIATFFASMISSTLGWIMTIVAVWCVYFFRDPVRYTPKEEGLIIAPADGIVSNIVNDFAPEELGLGKKEMTRVSIFLNVFDVHVNRVPCSGKILALHYHPGKFLNASLDKASKDNERQSVLMEALNTEKIAFVQIAGLIAKRIVCDLEEGIEVKAGQRFGIIRFGSRVDVYMPKKFASKVCIGQRMIGGETIIADMNEKTSKSYEFEAS